MAINNYHEEHEGHEEVDINPFALFVSFVVTQ
jgi:hypothetical protein